MPSYFRYVDDTLLCVLLDKLQTVIDAFNDYITRIQFTHEMERNNRIIFLNLEIIKLDNGKIVLTWYRKSTYSGRLLNFISNHLFQNKVTIIQNLAARAVSCESLYSENLDVVRKILFFNYYPQDLIEKYIIVYYVPRRIMRVITRRATMLAGDRSQGVAEAKPRRSRGAITPANIFESLESNSLDRWHRCYA